MAPDDFQSQWRERLASGSKLASKALATAAKEDPARVPLVAGLCADPRPAVRVAAVRALAEVATWRPELVAPHAQAVVEALGWPEPDAQEAALDALGRIAARAPAEAALALPIIAELMDHARRPGLREEAARCLGRVGVELPSTARAAAASLAAHLPAVKNVRAAQEAREVLAAIELLLPHIPVPDRALLAPKIAPLRAHPNIQVRERAGRVARALVS